ncbi:MAG TPA: penicillin-binding transpeptidase domain-containing protein [Acidimicrobiales bacterium]|nr:penicillin-binding transpeptidase domain-containing protein [Acidimicrobiales bacterium]
MRRKTVAAVALVAVIAAVGAGLVLTKSDSKPPLPRSEAEAFLAAWARGDAATVDRLSGSFTTAPTSTGATTNTTIPAPDPPKNPQTDPPPLTTPTASGDQARFKEALRISASRLELKGIRRSEEDDDTAVATIAATHTLAGLGEWRISSNVRFIRLNERWRVDWQPSALHAGAAPGDRFERERRRPDRAPIIGAGGQPITAIGKVVAVGVQPSRIRVQADVAAALRQHVGVDPARLDTALKARGVRPDHFVGLVELREERFRQVEPALRPVPGIVFQRKDARLSPAEGFAAHTLGRTGEITAEQLEQLGPTYQVGDVVGRSGLELAFERQLAGTPSGEIRLVKADGTPEVIHRFAGESSQPLEITLRPDVQRAADAALANLPPSKVPAQAQAPPSTTPETPTTPGNATAQTPAPMSPPPQQPAATPVPAALVAVDAATGQIVAVSSRPLSEPLNRALSGRYPPGSTFKIVTTDALIAAAGGRADQKVTCPPEVRVGGKRFKNFEGEALGDISLRDAFVHSCNTAFAPAGDRLGTEALVAAAARYGFGVDYRTGLGRATGGSFPEPNDAAERAAAAIGQGRVLATPAHMASVVAAATTGTWRAPQLLVATSAGAPATPAPTATPTPEAIDPLRDFLRGVVTQGTARVAARVPDLVGKTGTAEFGTGTPLPTHAWFVGERKGIAFAVLLEGGGVGGRDAAPIAAAFAAAL